MTRTIVLTLMTYPQYRKMLCCLRSWSFLLCLHSQSCWCPRWPQWHQVLQTLNSQKKSVQNFKCHSHFVMIKISSMARYKLITDRTWHVSFTLLMIPMFRLLYQIAQQGVIYRNYIKKGFIKLYLLQTFFMLLILQTDHSSS